MSSATGQEQPNLTIHQKAQLKHIQRLYQESLEHSTLSTTHHDGEETHEYLVVEDELEEAEKEVGYQNHAQHSAISRSAATSVENAPCGNDLSTNDPGREKSLSNAATSATRIRELVRSRRQGLLEQLDLAIAIRKDIESSWQELMREKRMQQGKSRKRRARRLMLRKEMEHNQLRLIALTEAAVGDYTLNNYDYYISHYETLTKKKSVWRTEHADSLTVLSTKTAPAVSRNSDHVVSRSKAENGKEKVVENEDETIKQGSQTQSSATIGESTSTQGHSDPAQLIKQTDGI